MRLKFPFIIVLFVSKETLYKSDFKITIFNEFNYLNNKVTKLFPIAHSYN